MKVSEKIAKLLEEAKIKAFNKQDLEREDVTLALSIVTDEYGYYVCLDKWLYDGEKSIHLGTLPAVGFGEEFGRALKGLSEDIEDMDIQYESVPNTITQNGRIYRLVD